MKKNPKFDAYIAKSAPFARPILKKLRASFHKADRGLVEEIKWGMPNFTKDGAIIGFMAAFKAHCAYGVWLVSKGFNRVKTLDDLPTQAELTKVVRKSVAARERGETLTSARKKKKRRAS